MRVLAVLSPAKSLDFESDPVTDRASEPRLVEDAAELAGVMAGKSEAEVAGLMSLSPRLAELNAGRFAAWEPAPSPPAARQAILAFDGDVYRGLAAAETFATRDLTHAQKVLRILSGLYGLLRPLDLILPYRLEMGTRLATARGEDLYDFWGSRVTDLLREDLAESPGTEALVDLASQEYRRVVDPDALGARVVTPTFLDAKGDGPHRVVSFFAKRARGAMAGWMVRERVTRIRWLTEFDGLGYRFDPERSRPDAPVFVRRDGGTGTDRNGGSA